MVAGRTSQRRGSRRLVLVAAAASFSGAGAAIDDVELVKRVIAAGTTYSAGDILAAGGTFFYLFNAMGIIPALYVRVP